MCFDLGNLSLISTGSSKNCSDYDVNDLFESDTDFDYVLDDFDDNTSYSIQPSNVAPNHELWPSM
jgi:hypothetical protein